MNRNTNTMHALLLNSILWIIVLVSCNGNTQNLLSDSPNTDQFTITNSPTRGMMVTDSIGTKYGFIHIESVIKNLDSLPLHIHLSMAYQKEYPSQYGDHSYKILLYPDMNSNELNRIGENGDALKRFENKDPNFLHEFNRVLLPGESSLMSIAIIRPVREDLCSVVPYNLFSVLDLNEYSDCIRPGFIDASSDTSLTLGLKIGYCTVGGNYDLCEIISCGQLVFEGP